MLKINFDAIKNPVMINPNEIEGILEGDHKVTVKRQMRGWEVNLQVVVDGFVFHDTQPDDKEKNQFVLLLDRAVEGMNSKRRFAMVFATQHLTTF